MRLFKSKSQKHEAVQFYVEPTDAPPVKDDIVIAVIIKNEEEAIEEWLQFHHAAGVDRFILYDNGSTDRTIALASKAVPSDALTVIPWAQHIQDAKLDRVIHNQGLAFAHAIGNFRHAARWMCFIDVDEFLFPTKGGNLRSVLDGLDHANNIIVPWAMFGRQGYQETPDAILPNYTMKHRDPYAAVVKGVLNFKCIVNPSKVTKVYVHGFEVEGTKAIWNANGTQFTFGDHRKPSFDQDAALQLNHYYIKSDTQLAEKVGKHIGDSIFTSAFKTTSSRQETLERRLREIERDTIEDRGIIEFCKKIGFE